MPGRPSSKVKAAGKAWKRVSCKPPPGAVPWFGGKSRIADRIIKLLPPSKIYVEPYAGAAAVLIRREPAPVEVLNDLDRHVTGFFRCLQDRASLDELKVRLAATPVSQTEFNRALEILAGEPTDLVTSAWAFFLAHNQAFCGKAPTSPGNWSRARNSSRGMASQVSAWWHRVDSIDRLRARLARVVIECRDALDLFDLWDGPETVFYADPPYTHESRKSSNDYRFEMDDAAHEALVNRLLAVRGSVLLSGYPTPLYDRLVEAGWARTEFQATSSTARGHSPQRTEVLWSNPAAVRALSPRAARVAKQRPSNRRP